MTEAKIRELRAANWSNPNEAQRRLLLSFLGVPTADHDRYIQAESDGVPDTQSNTNTRFPI